MNAALNIGDLTIRRIVEQEGPFLPALDVFPTLTAELLAENRHWLGARRRSVGTTCWSCAFQSYLVKTPHHTVLVDSCIGNDKIRPTREAGGTGADDDHYMRALAAAGVWCRGHRLCHVHPSARRSCRLEHAAREMAAGFRLFPRPATFFREGEYGYWAEQHAKTPIDAIADSVLPIVEAKRADLVTSGTCPGRPRPADADAGSHAGPFRCLSRPRRRRGGADRRPDPFAAAGALSGTGDARRLRSKAGLGDPARLSRALLRDTPTLCCTMHFPSPSVGHIKRWGDGFRCELAEA